VSNLAIGAEVPSTPEPALGAALAVLFGVLAVAALRRRTR
jgi:MYXO-CTERM domain-containing protein